MAARPLPSPAQNASPYSLLFLLGLMTLAVGAGMLILSVEERNLRIPGAAALLMGVVVSGASLTNRIFSGLYADPLAYEPPWAKLARGEGPPRLPAPGKPAAPPSAPESIGRLIDFPAPAAVRRPAMPANTPPPSAPETRKWTVELLERLSPHQFDAVCEALFAQSGLATRAQSHGPAGGVTLWLFSRNAQQDKNSPVAVAVCRLWPGQPVAVRQIHPLLAMMAARQLKRATYASTSTFTDNARKFARYNGINVLDSAGLLALIATRTPQQQQALLAAALARR